MTYRILVSVTALLTAITPLPLIAGSSVNPTGSAVSDLVLIADDKALTFETDAQNAVHQLIEDLIQAGTTFDTTELDRIYHDDMQVMMIDQDSNVMKANKADFIGLFETLKANGKEPLNTWAEYNDIAADDKTATVLVTRKVNLTGADQILVLNIDLVFEDDRWQVTRETIFARPDETS